jgi:hypothetical protein
MVSSDSSISAGSAMRSGGGEVRSRVTARGRASTADRTGRGTRAAGEVIAAQAIARKPAAR